MDKYRGWTIRNDFDNPLVKYYAINDDTYDGVEDSATKNDICYGNTIEEIKNDIDQFIVEAKA